MAHDPAGLHVIAFWHQRLRHAVDLLDGVPIEDRLAMKVRAGEPLAAILLTAMFMSAPIDVGSSGGVDLTFDVDAPGTAGLFPPGRQAVEVKSIGSKFRKHDAAIERGDVSVGDGLEVVLESAQTVVTSMRALVQRAAAKTSSTEADARHAFVIVHPFEHFIIEIFDRLVGAQLPPVDLPAPLDALWIVWHPLELTVWSRSTARWTQVVFNATNEDADEDEDGYDEPLQAAERLFLDRLPRDGGSPFQYRVSGD